MSRFPHEVRRGVRCLAAALSLVAAVSSCGHAGPKAAKESGPLRVESRAFAENGLIPSNYSCIGADSSPPIAWHGAAPAGTQTWAIVMTDVDVKPGPWIQWLVTGIPLSSRSVAPGTLPAGAAVLRASNGTAGFVGACPPAGKVHHYRFTVYAVRGGQSVRSGVTAAEAAQAISTASVGNASLSARFAR